LMQTGGGDAAV